MSAKSMLCAAVVIAGTGFSASRMLGLARAQEAARDAGAATPLGAEAAELYRRYAGAGHAGEDFSGIINFIRRKAVV